jgi:hypothetical protein
MYTEDPIRNTEIYWLPFTLFVSSFVLLVLAFVFPFIRIEFDPEIPSELKTIKDVVYGGKGVVGDILNKVGIGKEVTDQVLTGTIGDFFGDLFSDKCKPNWDQCFREWLADKAGLHLGNQYLLGMLVESARLKDFVIMFLLGLFSIIFPLSKIILGMMISGSSTPVIKEQMLFKYLYYTSKWSMTDVFIVALCVMTLKVEKFHLAFVPEWGVICFALSTILASIGGIVLGKELGFSMQFSQKNPAESNLPNSNNGTW